MFPFCPKTLPKPTKTLLRATVSAVLAFTIAAANAPSPVLAASPASASDSSAPIVVTDQRGVTVRLDKPAERVVLFPMPAAALFTAVSGGTERIAGMHSMAKVALEDGILGKIFPEAKAIASNIAYSGFVPNVEGVLNLNPDVVIQWNQGEELIVPLENAGIPVVALNYGTQEDLATWMRLMGTLSGQSARAERLIAWQEQKLADLQQRLSTFSGQERPRILYFIRLAEQLRVQGADTYNDFYIRLVGGTNVAGDVSGTVDINEEQLLTWNPDIILIGNFDSATPENVYGRPLWQDVSAVKNRRVYKVPLGGYRWDPPNQESPLMWLWLAALTHPESFQVDLPAEMREAYRMLYGYELTDEDILSILHAEINEGAANYDVVIGAGVAR